MREVGWVEGQNMVIERRYGESADQLHASAAELVRLVVDHHQDLCAFIAWVPPGPDRPGCGAHEGCNETHLVFQRVEQAGTFFESPVVRQRLPVVYPALTSRSAFSSQNRMSISRYIAIAVVRCSCAWSRLPMLP
jgi:hypothetical protein